MCYIMRLVILLSLLHVAVSHDQEPPSDASDKTEFQRHFCPDNQRWLQCGPPCGDRRCPRQINNVAFSRCDSTRCGNPGCYCERGFVRDHNGQCIQEDDCPRQCQNDNEKVDKCGDECEAKCPSSLEEAGGRPSCHRQTCGRPACVCEDGYYRSPRGSCVKLEDCPSICGPNEFYNPCGNACEDTCRNFNSGQQTFCTRHCDRSGGCQCKRGFYRNAQGRCVPPSQCQGLTFQQCRGPNQMLDRCAPPIQCQPHCNRDDWPRTCFQNRGQCRPGCVCKHGYVRNFNEDCIPRDRCFGHRGGKGGH